MTDEQIRLIGELDAVTRGAMKGLLIRGIDTASPPPPSELVERLSIRGTRLRADLVKQAEAIVLEAVLTPAQASRWLAKNDRPAPALSGRYLQMRIRADDSPLEGLGSYDTAIRMEARRLSLERVHALNLFDVFHDPAEQPVIGMTADQAELIRRLDRATQDAIRAWLLLRPADDRAYPRGALRRPGPASHDREDVRQSDESAGKPRRACREDRTQWHPDACPGTCLKTEVLDPQRDVCTPRPGSL